MYAILTSWCLALMTAFAPLERAAQVQAFPGYEETIQQRGERYEAIASAVVSVAFDPHRLPVYKGPNGRARTAALLLAVAYHESGFSKDVDEGPCYRGPDGKSARCDGGHAACMMQIHPGPGAVTSEGWTEADLFGDRRKCFASGMESLRKAAQTCAKYGQEYTFSSYAAGTCDRRGLKGSKELLALQDRFYKRLPVPLEARDGRRLPDSEGEWDAQRLLSPSPSPAVQAPASRAPSEQTTAINLAQGRPSGS